ncbi:MAG: hypothetical protein JRI59_11620, partial [Deltaproteobacteria bacterium]|nr:hypothetical protein [Deltaproteobacteria bacterium]
MWAADKLIPRRWARDAWTRALHLALPADPVWAGLLPRLARILRFLTGDHWAFTPREAPLHLGVAATWLPDKAPEAVVLFSGGLDSLVGAIDWLEEGRCLLLVSHYDFGQLASIQQRLAALLKEAYGPERLHHVGLRVQFPETREFTLRSRSLLFLALGLSAAAACGPGTPLVMPENGWISLNP